MNVTIANISTTIDDVQLQTAIAAIQRQVNEDFQPEWGVNAALIGIIVSLHNTQAPIQGKHDAIIYIGDTSQDPTIGVSGVAGYHTTNYAAIKRYGKSGR